MGQFSWLDCCDSNVQILDDVRRNVYVLVPEKYGGGHILEECYDGYGNFGGHDIYDLVADWNKHAIPRMLESETKWADLKGRHKEDVLNFYEGKPIKCEKRIIGILMACYDEDNMALDYPIKITHNECAVYEDCCPSLEDPDQGWGCY